MAGWVTDNLHLGRAPAEAGVHLTIGEARFLLALMNECWATKGSIANSIYCYQQSVEIADKLKQAVLGAPR